MEGRGRFLWAWVLSPTSIAGTAFVKYQTVEAVHHALKALGPTAEMSGRKVKVAAVGVWCGASVHILDGAAGLD